MHRVWRRLEEVDDEKLIDLWIDYHKRLVVLLEPGD